MKTGGVLLIKDPTFLRRKIRQRLAADPSFGTPAIADNSIDALRELNRGRPSVVVVDLQTEGLTVSIFLRYVQHLPDTKVVALVGELQLTAERKTELQSSGVHGIVEVPFDLREGARLEELAHEVAVAVHRVLLS